MLYIGIDLGTSSVKLLLMDAAGNVKNIVSREYPLYFPNPGWSEQKPEDWYKETMQGLKELLEGFPKEEVAGISFGGQMHGLVILDDKDEVIRPAILWNDGRTTEECDYLNNEIGKETLSEYTANISFTGFTAPKILWVKNKEPENFARIKKIMLPKDYLAYKLTGEHCTDVSDASGMLLLDVKNRCWSKEMCEICGITTDMLPKLYESYECVGTVLPEIAKELGLSENVKVAAGAGDNAAAAVATGTVGDGKCNISLGTSGTIFISSAKFGVDKHNALHAFCDANGAYHLMGCMLSAASCNKWWMDEIIGTKDYKKEQEAQRLATALEIYVNGSLKVFNHRTNVELSNRIVCFDIKDLGKQLKKLGMLIVQDQVWNRVTVNRSANKSTRYYIDEFHLLLKEEQTAAYSVEIWKRFRKWGGIPTGITQNVKDLLASREIENIFENSDFILMLNQASGDRQILAKQLNISPHQLSYVTNSGEGEGLVFYGSTIIPFKDKFDNSLMLYALMTSKPDEVEKRKKLGIGERDD